ncbi:MAG: asparagine--tRNA ligase, partial [Ignavibacteriales bacterium]|nr:asparagine--tRNA ligase [Ignavibacteriales bacterium]
MARVYIEELSKHVGEEVAIRGWVYNKRSSGKIRFIVVRDGTGLLQCVMVKGMIPDDVFNHFDSLTQESSLTVIGKIKKDDRAPGGYEMELSNLQVISIAKEYPITPKEHGVDFLMDHRHLWLRSSRQHAILRIRHQIITAIREFFDNHGFILMD